MRRLRIMRMMLEPCTIRLRLQFDSLESGHFDLAKCDTQEEKLLILPVMVHTWMHMTTNGSPTITAWQYDSTNSYPKDVWPFYLWLHTNRSHLWAVEKYQRVPIYETSIFQKNMSLVIILEQPWGPCKIVEVNNVNKQFSFASMSRPFCGWVSVASAVKNTLVYWLTPRLFVYPQLLLNSRQPLLKTTLSTSGY